MALYISLEPFTYVKDADEVVHVSEVGRIIELTTDQAALYPGVIAYWGSGSTYLAPQITMLSYDSSLLFPGEGSKFHVYLDQSTGRLWQWGETVGEYTLVSTMSPVDPSDIDGITPTGEALLTAPNIAAARAAIEVPKNLKDFGAIADGTYNPTTHAMTGTDNTAAINAALATGQPVLIPPGYFRYTGQLHTNVNGSGLVGSGKGTSFLITDHSLDFHIAVVQGTQNTTWTDFSMIGPFIDDGDDFNRALLIGSNDAHTDVADAAWDATGTWIDDFVTEGYCAGVHVALAGNVRFGTIEVFEAGNDRAEPGAYGITCSGSNLYGKLLRVINTTTIARHALYYNGVANDCFVEVVEAKGLAFAAIQQRATTGGGQRNGFGRAVLEDCNTNDGVEPVTSLRSVVNFGTASDVVVAGAGGARIGDYVAINCGGFPGPSVRYMPNTRCGTVQVYGHAGTSHFTTDHFGSHVYNSANVQLPLMMFVSGFDAAGLNDATFKPMVVEASSNCYGGGVRVHAGAIFSNGATVTDSSNVRIPSLMLAGTYAYAVSWTGTSDFCGVDNVIALNAPTSGTVNDTSSGTKQNGVGAARFNGGQTLTLPTGIDLKLFNTADQATNYELARAFWASNVFNIQSTAGGTGTGRSISIGVGTTNSLRVNPTGTRVVADASTGSATGNVFGVTGTLSGASGVQRAARISPVLTQTATAGYTALEIDVTETSVGSGAKNLIDARVGGASVFTVDNAGVVSPVVAPQIHAATAKATPVDADEFPLVDTAASNVVKKWTLGNLKTVVAAWLTTLTATWANKTLTSPVINTPTGIVKGDVGLGNVDNTSDATKRAPRVTTITSSATPTFNTNNIDALDITTLTTAITSMTSGRTGTLVNFQRLLVRISSASAQAIAWGTDYVSGSVALPTTTVAGKPLMVGFIVDTAGKLACEASGSRA